MTSDKHDFEELTAPAATARELHLSVATLRKYSLIVERVTGKADYYARTKQNARLYSRQDIQDLKDFHQLAQDNGLTLQEAAQQVFAVSNREEVPAKKQSDQQEDLTSSQMMKLLTAFQQTIRQQNVALENLQKQLDRIEAQNQQLLAKPKVKEEIFANLPDISGIVDDDELLADLPSKKVDQPLTPAEKRQQLAEDKEKTPAEMRAEILTKAKENAQKAKHNEHRTLADMQVKPNKRHWWQSLFNR